jgi:YVTN family beta-propeller protein
VSELPTGTVTFVFTDIEGSTQMLNRLGPRYAELLAEHQRIVRAAVAAHHGHEVDTQGDSFFVAFRRGKDAVAAVVAIQRDLAGHEWPDGGAIKLRIGLHTGEPQVGEDRYVGMGVNKAARIGAAGHGGQVLISRTTRDLVEDELPPGVTIRDLGERRLKDIERPEHLFQLVIEGLQSEFGQLKTLDVELARKRRRMYVGAALIGVLAAAVAIPVFALGQGSGGGGATVAPNSVAIIDPASNTIVDSVPNVGVDPDAITVGEGSVWVANTADQTVARIDVQTRKLIRTLPVGEYPSDLAVATSAVWVALGGFRVSRIDLDQNAIDQDISVSPSGLDCPRPAVSLAYGRAALWLACTNYGDISAAIRIDPLTKTVVPLEDALVSSLPVAALFSDIAFGFGSAWISNSGGNTVVQIEAATLRKLREVAVGKGPAAVAVGAGSVWVANADNDTVSRFGLEALVQSTEPVVVKSIAVGDRPEDVAVGESAVWVVNAGDRTIQRIDPATDKVVATIQLENRPMHVAVGGALLWVTVQKAAG